MEQPRKKQRRSSSASNSAVTSTVPEAPTDQEITEKDLPLLANVTEVKVHHYLMQLSTDFAKKTACGQVILFLEWIKHENVTEIVLDACCLNVKKVVSLKPAQDYDVVNQLEQHNDGTGNRKYFYKRNVNWFEADATEELNFAVSKWSIVISGWEKLPSVVKIEYETLESSPSLHWRPCRGYTYGEEDGVVCKNNRCVYTPAPPVNNRGLFPCQEPPSAMATWEVILEVENYFTPLLTSDEPGEVLAVGKSATRHYFYTSVPMPASTFALVIGQFSLQTATLHPPEAIKVGAVGLNIPDNACQNHIKHPCRFTDRTSQQEAVIPIRLFSLDTEYITSLDINRFSNFVFHSLKSSFENLGPHPFGRLDLVIMPKCYPHVGLANPSMTFLSASNFTGQDEPLFIGRVPHEICHSWFGLLIGSLDWTEEWLSEGFATFCEDILFQHAYQHYYPEKSEADARNEVALRVCARFITLQNELKNNTENDLVQMCYAEGESRDQVAKNGLVPIKQFMHVHYYKGYLFLWYLAFLVGEKKFMEFLKEYVWKYHGQLVTSDIFLDCFYEKFTDSLCAANKTVFISKYRAAWLESDKLPSPFDFNAIEKLRGDIQVASFLPLFTNASSSVQKVGVLYEKLKASNIQPSELQHLSNAEMLLLFDLILSSYESIKILKTCYDQLKKKFSFNSEKHNPDIMHKWCELILLCKDLDGFSTIKQFLENNFAMGVYLYGELMISENRKFQQLAQDLYKKMEGLYDMGTKRILKEMLF